MKVEVSENSNIRVVLQILDRMRVDELRLICILLANLFVSLNKRVDISSHFDQIVCVHEE